MSSFEVLAAGPLTTVQDEGRSGLAALGVGRSGAADRRSYGLANRLLANPDGAAALEVTLGGLSLRVGDETWFAVTGADLEVLVDSGSGPVAVGRNAAFVVPAGGTLTLGMARAGLRAYVAVRGGVAVEPTLGSRSTDTLSGLGPEPLAEGDTLAIGPRPGDLPDLDVAAVATPEADEVELSVLRGPRDDWVVDVDDLVHTVWQASDHSDRVGMRLSGNAPGLRHRDEDRQLPSEGLVRGSIQVPPSGEPVIFLADHPMTGGYPVVAVLVDEDTDIAAQIRPGQSVRLHWSRR
ncbi:biotin-dependent carboxyltransferase family protein [Williamsia soli]|uniref:5-oxoprolinase subunit C family protein n=1 Tax=Williamsia soli TaxID=364929 RepID=UPI001A9F1015|nr:biotin-dependent carboxyltransferase family protein [Williamsia soli]